MTPFFIGVIFFFIKKILVEWNRVQTHERNQVRYRLQVAEAESDQFNEVFEGGAIFFKVNNLRRATNYKFRVQVRVASFSTKICPAFDLG